MNQLNATAQSAIPAGAGGALAIMLLFAVELWAPEVYTRMETMHIQAFTLLVIWGSSRVYSLLGPKGNMP